MRGVERGRRGGWLLREGQDEMRLSLVLNVVDPRIGGVMVMGDR